MSIERATHYERAYQILRALFVIALLFVSIDIMMRPKPAPPPNRKAFGCYATDHAAPISLDQHGMTIHQTAPIHIGFHLEKGKTGIELIADAPIAANPGQTGYRYSITPPGIGWTLDFVRSDDGHWYGVFDPDALGQFTMLARDHAYLLYHKTDSSACGLPG